MSVSIKRALAATLAVLLLVSGVPGKASNVTTGSKTLYTIGNTSYENNSSIHKGNSHDCQNFGIWIPKGAVFKIRQTNLDFGQTLTVKLRNDDRLTEVVDNLPCDGTWLELTALADSVPLVTSLYSANGEKPTVEYSVENAGELPIYNFGDDEAAFFAKWDALGAPFAMFLSEYSIWLVPERDKENNKMGSLDDLLLWYDNMVRQYNAFSGLSRDAEEEWNRDSGSKYFIKANRNGYGAAYYSVVETAPNSESLASYMVRDNWGPLHEVGHGYDTVNFGSAEIWNNVLSHYYQVANFGAGNWLHLDDGWRNVFESDRAAVGGYLKSERFDTRLYFWVNMLDKLGPQETSAAAYQLYRANQVNGVENVSSYSFYANAYTLSSGFNVVPWFDLWEIPVEDTIRAQLLEAELYENIYPLFNLLKPVESEVSPAAQTIDPTAAKWASLAEALELDSVYSMVETRQMVDYVNSLSDDLGLTSTLSIKLDAAAFALLQGKTLRITDGRDLVQAVEITNQTLNLTLPIGVYNIYLPAAESATTLLSNQTGCVVLTQGDTIEYPVTATTLTKSYDFVDWTFTFSSTYTYNGTFCTATTDLKNGTLRIAAVESKPHTYIDLYSYLKVYDETGAEIYAKECSGKGIEAFDDTISIQPGYEIEVYQAEPGRGHTVQSSAVSAYKLINNNSHLPEGKGSSTSRFKVTATGLAMLSPSAISGDEVYYRVLAARLDELRANHPDAEFQDPKKMPAEKVTFNAAAQRLSAEMLEKLKTDYSAVYPFDTGVRELTIDPIAPQDHTGAAVTPILTVRLGDVTLTADQYTCVWSRNVKVGTAQVKVYGKGEYSACTAQAEFTIRLPESLPKTLTVVSDTPEYTYTGGEKYPYATVTLGDRTLIRNVDYELSYADNKEVGTATIIATGIGDYAGLTGTGTFRIVAAKPVSFTVTVGQDKYVANGQPHTPDVTVRALKNVVAPADYTVSYSDNVEVGTATVTVTGVGNYAGSTGTGTFRITAPLEKPALEGGTVFSNWTYTLYSWYSPYSILSFDMEKSQLTVEHRAIQPHYLFTTDYASIQVFDSNDSLVYEKHYIGDQTSPAGVDTIPLEQGYEVELYVAEPERAETYARSDAASTVSMRPISKARYRLTARGLQAINEDGSLSENDPSAKYPQVLSAYLTALQEANAKSDFADPTKLTEEKALFKKAAAQLTADERAALENDFKGYFPFDGEAPSSGGSSSGGSSSGGSSSGGSSSATPSPAPSPAPSTPSPTLSPTLSRPEPTVSLEDFTDLSPTMYYYEPIRWAVENGITNGLEKDKFAPEESCTRGQMITFLWRAAGCPKPAKKYTNFDDLDAYSYYFQAVLWATETGITNGLTPTLFAPDLPLSRAQAVTMIYRWQGGNPSAATVSWNFEDVSNEDYYASAVAWAAQNSITTGTTQTSFSPEQDCTRGQIVTMLFRNENREK